MKTIKSLISLVSTVGKVAGTIGLAARLLIPPAYGEEAKEVEPGLWYNPKGKVVDVYRNEEGYVNLLKKRFATPEQLNLETSGKLGSSEKQDATMFYVVSFREGVVEPSFFSSPKKYNTHEKEGSKMYHSLAEALKSKEMSREVKKDGNFVGGEWWNSYIVAVDVAENDQVKLYNCDGELIAYLQGENFIWGKDKYESRNELKKIYLKISLKRQLEGEKLKKEEQEEKPKPNFKISVGNE